MLVSLKIIKCVLTQFVVIVSSVQGLIGYFDIGFDGIQRPVHLSTSPNDLPTHWKQTIFFFKQPLSVHTGN